MLDNNGYLIILNGSNPVYEIELKNKNRISFGRSRTNDIILDSSIVSKVHGYFECIEGNLCVYDNASTNGIYINDVFFGSDENGDTVLHIMQDGDIIRIDDYDRSASNGIIMMYEKSEREGRWQEYPLEPGETITIGRGRDCSVHLDDISVSRLHASIETRGDKAYIIDENSSNGVFLNGEKLENEAPLEERDVISIANALFFYTKNILLYKADIGGTRVVMQGVNRTVKTKQGMRQILHNVNICIEPNEFVAIIGGSGSGKSTVMNAMSGFEQATSGTVRINSIDLYKNHRLLKNTIGYVPQQDIIYENLTLKKMLEYSARMRMSGDVSESEIQRRIDEVLDMVELKEHKDKMIRSLSGGQKKRASIAVELLGNPGLFFLDEPTSGLDPGTEESLMINLRKLSKQNGKTIVMVTHTTQNLHLCDKLLFMGYGGRVCFFGTVRECLRFFGTENITEIYNMVADESSSKKWANRFYNKMSVVQYAERADRENIISYKKEPFFKQLFILTARYTKLIKNDVQRLLMILLQPILIGALLGLVASDTVFEIYNGTKSIIFALSCAGIWMGLFNSIQEICKERVILKREYMANMRMDAYVMSKYIVQFAISAVQSVLICLVFSILVGIPEKGAIWGVALPEYMLTMLLTIFSSAGIGLVVSSISKNSDKVMTAAPFLLIVQLLFSGILFELSGAAVGISYATISRWSVAALGISSDLNGLPSAGGVPRSFEELFKYSSGNIAGTWLIMFGFAVASIVLSAILLRNVSKDSR